MQNVNEKFKDSHPAKTVERIQSILKELGMELEEYWHDSGIENCYSLTVREKSTFTLRTNGKGVTKELARASAYGEFMERLQCGLFFYKYQSIGRDREMNLQTFAPDGRFMTLQELEESGEWMDPIIQTYGGGLTRRKLAEQCRMYACADNGLVWTVPYYSLFEDKYVYLPTGFVEQMYSANGCCAGNTREEAWVHALSEILERKSSGTVLTEGTSLVPIPPEVISRYPTAVRILDEIRQSGKYDVTIFDASFGKSIPVIATRIINKSSHGYLVTFAADPILEIAIDRSLTEAFQGRNIKNYESFHNGNVLEEEGNLPASHNLLNQLENGNGIFPVDFFTEEANCSDMFSEYPDLSDKNNKELLDHILSIYKKLDKPVYVRNNSFLGFNCYKFVVPGFSESRGARLTEPLPEYALGDSVVRVLRDVASADASELHTLLMFHKKISTAFSRRSNFSGLAGLPMDRQYNAMLLYITLSYAAYRLKLYPQAVKYLDSLLRSKVVDAEIKEYFVCVQRYLNLKRAQVPEEKIRLLLNKCYETKYVEKLFGNLSEGKTPYDAYLLHCDITGCSQCRYRAACSYENTKRIISKAGQKYQAFLDGQHKREFV